MLLVSILSTQLRLLCERSLLWVFLYTDGFYFIVTFCLGFAAYLAHIQVLCLMLSICVVVCNKMEFGNTFFTIQFQACKQD